MARRTELSCRRTVPRAATLTRELAWRSLSGAIGLLWRLSGENELVLAVDGVEREITCSDDAKASMFADAQRCALGRDGELFIVRDGQRITATIGVELDEAVIDHALAFATIWLSTDASLASLPWLVDGAQQDGPHRPAFLELNAATEIFAALARHAEKRAIACGAETLTYAELDLAAHAYAARLHEHDVHAGDLVAVCMDRSPLVLAAMLGVWRVGAAYVPLDPELPDERIAYIVQDAGAQVAIADAHGEEKLGLFGGVIITERGPHPDGAALTLPQGEGGAVQRRRVTAYVMYTSGSTGRPKGVAIGHSALANFLRSMDETLGTFTHALALTSISFDISGLELYLPLIRGAAIVLATKDETRDPHALARLIESGVDLIQGTPSTFRMLSDAGFRPGRAMTLLCGGEAWTNALKQTLCAWSENVWNVYGPTETTIWSAARRVLAADDDVRIGGPLANTRLVVCDRSRQPVPYGVPGELCIGGAGLADGYWRRDDLTADKFFERDGERLYATGDWVVCHPNGDIDFRGRIDHQVKVRGHRIELGEIEAQLCEHLGVKAAAVIVQDERIVAFVVSHAEAADLRHHLQQTLPAYMLPNTFVFLDTLPLGPTGKIDRKALAARGER